MLASFPCLSAYTLFLTPTALQLPPSLSTKMRTNTVFLIFAAAAASVAAQGGHQGESQSGDVRPAVEPEVDHEEKPEAKPKAKPEIPEPAQDDLLFNLVRPQSSFLSF